MSILNDPFTLTCCLVSVFLVGMSRGGFGGAMGMMGVPVMAIALPPVQSAAILLPILILSDIFGLWSWRKNYDTRTLRILLPGGVIGIAVGWLAAVYVSDDTVRLLVGILSLIFVAHYVYKTTTDREATETGSEHKPLVGSFWGLIAGFTSFVSHIGAPPFQVYVLPLRLTPSVFAGTTVRFFFALNAIKLAPYFALGQFDAANIKISLMLMPVAPLATILGVFIVKRIKPETFYPFMYFLMFLAGLKLIYDSISF